MENVKKRARNWHPFEEARAFVHALQLKYVTEWRAFSKSGQKPHDIPTSPENVYAEFLGYGDWLGTGRKWRPFEEARAFVHKLQLKNVAEWKAYKKSGEKPHDIPTQPEGVYEEFLNYGDWLGTGTDSMRDRHYRPFSQARAFVHDLHLKNEDEWRAYCKSGKKPDDIPAGPAGVYKDEFQGMGDWIGTGFVAVRYREFLSFEEAHAFVRALGLKNRQEWRDYCASGKRPPNIPSGPETAYPSEFLTMGDWLGTGTIAPRSRKYLSFHEVRAFVHKLNLKSKDDWVAYCKSGEKPENIPTDPRRVYQREFKGYGDWLNTGTIASFQRAYRPFAEARSYVQALSLKNGAEWGTYCKSGKKPDDIPAAPWGSYEEDFISMGDWLGTGYIAARQRVYLPFEEARAFARRLGLKDSQAWVDYCASGSKPENIPASPENAYKDQFKGMADWLGSVNKWNRKALLALLYNLRPRLDHLEEPELYVILQQGGAFPRLRLVLGGASPKQVLNDLKWNGGRTLEKALQELSDEEIATPLGGTIAEENVLPPFDASTVEAAQEDVLPDASLPLLDPSRNDGGRHLPTFSLREHLHDVDQLESLPCGLDAEAAEYLVANRISSLWECYISEGIRRVDELLSEKGGYWYTTIKQRFYVEVEAVESLVLPEGWSFTDENDNLALPNAMQRRTAWTVREKRRMGNWSGIGSGKTLSAILTSCVIDAHVTLIVTNNATVEKVWRPQIKRAYPDSYIPDQVEDGLLLDRNRYSYIILNYEKFQGPSRDHLVHLLLNQSIDFIVFDEVQFIKQRDKQASKRRKTLEALVHNVAARNPQLCVLGMSATPVINTLLEAKKLLEIVTGMGFPELGTASTISNALAMHRALMLYGFRYRPRYEQEMCLLPVSITRNDLIEALQHAQASPLHIEQELLSAKLDAVRPFLRKGTIVYADYVDGIVAPLRQSLEAMGFTVGLYTGSDKSGFEPFCKGSLDLLIGTRPVGTGLDGLQKVCNRLIFLCLPWTGAEYEQVVGRIRRQGSHFEKVEVIVPQVLLDYEGDIWSWDRWRMGCIDYKLTLSDCVLNGSIPLTVRIDQRALVLQSREALERWIERIDKDGPFPGERQQLAVPLPPNIRYKVQAHHGDFTALNQRWNIARSETTHERIHQGESEWYLYHTLYREAREKWVEQPFEKIAEHIRIRPDRIIGDFGCGECLLRQALPYNNVIGIDHVAWNDQVIACDMSSTPLDEACLDVVVFSLSLMGINWKDYIKEAYRTLKPYGYIFIAEPYKKWQDRMEELKQAIETEKFRLLGDMEQRYDFIYLTALKM